MIYYQIIFIFAPANGGIAQLARAFDWQSKGLGFDSPYLHGKSISEKPRKWGFFLLQIGYYSFTLNSPCNTI